MLISLTGPSGVGKGFFKDKFFARYPNATEAVWATTRKARPGEGIVHGRRCIHLAEFQRLRELHQLFFIQQLYGNWYGMVWTEELVGKSGLCITELHIDNLIKARQVGLDIAAFALIPVDMAFLKKRLEVYRRTESPDQVSLRLAHAEKEIEKIRVCRGLLRCIFSISEENEPVISEEFLSQVDEMMKEGDHAQD